MPATDSTRTTPAPELPVVGVGVVIVEDGQLLVVKRGRDPGRGLWAVPGGKVRRGETLVEAAEREAYEETGLRVDVGDVVWVGEHIDRDSHLVLIDFIATVASGEARASDDAVDLAWVPIEDPGDLPLTLTMHQLLDTLRS